MLLSKNSFIVSEDLPNSVKQAQSHLPKDYQSMSLKEALAGPDKNIIRQALKTHHWNMQQTAEAFEINRTTLFKKMKK